MPDYPTVPDVPDNVPDLAIWETALADVPDSTPGDVPDNVPDVRGGWRIEVTRNGRYWHWRKGSHRNRKTLPGGRFETLSEERKAAYYENVQRQRERKNQVDTR